MTPRPPRWFTRSRSNLASDQQIQGRQDSDSASDTQEPQARATVKAARITAAATIITVIGTAIGLSIQIDAAKDEANRSFTRGIATGPYTAYVAVLIDAETEFSRVRKEIAGGVPSARADQLKADIDAVLVRIKEDKAPVDLVATDELRNMADLTINLYGKIGGDIKNRLDQRECQPKTQLEPCEKHVLPDPFYKENDVPPNGIRDQDYMVHKIWCAETAGRVVFTETAQQSLGLEGVDNPDYSDGCYTTWLTERDKWPKVVQDKHPLQTPLP